MKDENKKSINKDETSKKSGNKNKGNAANIDAIISSPTENVRSRRSSETWSNTGTNISYEDETAAGGAGSVGTGQGTGAHTGATISGSSEYEHGRAEHPNKKDNKDAEEED